MKMKNLIVQVILIVIFSIIAGMQLEAILEIQGETQRLNELYSYGLQFSEGWYKNWQSDLTWRYGLFYTSLIALVAVSLSLGITEWRKFNQILSSKRS